MNGIHVFEARTYRKLLIFGAATLFLHGVQETSLVYADDDKAAVAKTWAADAKTWATDAKSWAADARLIRPLPDQKPSPPDGRGSYQNDIDRFIAARWREQGERPAPLCDDETFIRRVYLDLAGVIPPHGDVQAFQDESRDRRDKLVDRLLSSDRYAEHWAVFWGDLFREQSNIRGMPRMAFRDYILDSLRRNKPYDAWVREMLQAGGNGQDNPETGFLLRHRNDRNDAVVSITQVFLGLQLKCAQCHDHPYEAWKQDDFKGMAGFFKGTRRRRAFVKEVDRNGRTVERQIDEVVSNGKGKGRFLTGDKPYLGRGRIALANLVTERANPYFARVAVNRLWAKLMGAGLVDPPDEFSVSNPPSHPALLDWLAIEFVDSGYDLKHVLRLICKSRTYQLASRGRRGAAQDDEGVRLYAQMPLRRLTAEQLHDSILRACGVLSIGRPATRPAIEKPYPARNGSFLQVFGSHDRKTVHERDTEGTIPQALTLMNGDFVNRSVRAYAQRTIRKWLKSGMSRGDVVERMFVATLCRKPTARERKWSLEMANSVDGWSDVQWALINSREFMFIR